MKDVTFPCRWSDAEGGRVVRAHVRVDTDRVVLTGEQRPYRALTLRLYERDTDTVVGELILGEDSVASVVKLCLEAP